MVSSLPLVTDFYRLKLLGGVTVFRGRLGTAPWVRRFPQRVLERPVVFVAVVVVVIRLLTQVVQQMRLSLDLVHIDLALSHCQQELFESLAWVHEWLLLTVRVSRRVRPLQTWPAPAPVGWRSPTAVTALSRTRVLVRGSHHRPLLLLRRQNLSRGYGRLHQWFLRRVLVLHGALTYAAQCRHLPALHYLRCALNEARYSCLNLRIPWSYRRSSVWTAYWTRSRRLFITF